MKKDTVKQEEELKNVNTKPIKNKEEVQQSNDEKIDQDFPGFPHSPSSEEIIKKQKKSTE